MQRYKDGYYRSKDKHAEIYEKIFILYASYITEKALAMLAHPFSTRTNEAMNKSVSVFAPKGKTVSLTEPLDTRVEFVAGVLILGYELFWESVFEEFEIQLDDNLRKYLKRLQRNKDRKREKASTKEEKSRRSRKKCDKMRSELQQDMTTQKGSMVYETGIAMKTA